MKHNFHKISIMSQEIVYKMSPKPQRNCEIELYAFNFVVKDKNATLHASPRQTEVI